MQRECLRRVRERHGTLAGRVEDLEQIHACRDHGDTLLAQGVVGFDPEGEAGPEEADGQEGEGEEQEVAAAPGVDGEEGGESEDPVEDAGAHGCEEGFLDAVAGFDEDGGGIVGDYVDAAELSNYLAQCRFKVKWNQTLVPVA